jgi:PleD family two-component response regulator
MKILLIKDSGFQRMANGRALAEAGYNVVYTADGEEGLRCRSREHSRSYSAQYNVAKMSGLEVLRAVKGDALLKHISPSSC